MTMRAHPTHCVRIPESEIRRSNGDDLYLHEQNSESSSRQSATQSAATNALVYLREKKNEASPRSVRFFNDAIDSLTDSQRQELYCNFQAHTPDVKTLVAGLCNLSSDQLDWLSKTIASQLERYLIPDWFDNQIRTGAYAHKLIEKRQKARDGQRTRLRGDGPYETVMEDAMRLFGCSSSALQHAYSDFKWMRSARMVDENGSFIQAKSREGDNGDGQ